MLIICRNALSRNRNVSVGQKLNLMRSYDNFQKEEGLSPFQGIKYVPTELTHYVVGLTQLKWTESNIQADSVGLNHTSFIQSLNMKRRKLAKNKIIVLKVRLENRLITKLVSLL